MLGKSSHDGMISSLEQEHHVLLMSVSAVGYPSLCILYHLLLSLILLFSMLVPDPVALDFSFFLHKIINRLGSYPMPE